MTHEAAKHEKTNMAQVGIYREIDALGGTGEGDWHKGYSEALTDVLAILAKRGFDDAGNVASMSDSPPKPLTVRELGEYSRYIHGADYSDNSIEAVAQRQARFTELRGRYLAASIKDMNHDG